MPKPTLLCQFLLHFLLLHFRRFTLVLLAAFGSVMTLQAQTLYFPPAVGDWETVDPVSVGWQPELLSQALAVAGERNSSGVVILHNGRIMAERYWEMTDPPQGYNNVLQGFDSQGRAIEDVASAQKSVAAILTGIAQQKGLVGIGAAVSNYLGVGLSKATPEQEQQITLLHLLNMTSGLSTGMEYEAAAGSRWLYNTPAYHFLMRALEAASGEDRNVFTRNWLTGPLGMSNTQWTARPWADADIGVGLSTTARELARFGLLIHANGRWGDQVIISDTAFLQDMQRSSQSLNPSYGYLWWLNGKEFSLNAGARAVRSDGWLIPAAPEDLIAMQGAQDRKLYIVPSLSLVVARLGSTGVRDGQSFNNAFWEALLKAHIE